MQIKVVVDVGHTIWKGKRSTGEEIAIPHAITQLSDSQYLDIVNAYGKQNIPPDFMKVNDTPFVVGSSAEVHGITSPATGAKRYRRDYYGVAVMNVVTRLYPKGDYNLDVELFASHPPGHISYCDKLIQSVTGDWHVETGGRQYNINVGYVNTFDEPTGGLMNVLLNQEGDRYQRTELKEAQLLVIDIGGGTTDFIVISAGEINYATARTEPLGILNVINTFESSFRARYKELSSGTMKLNPARVRDAIVTGVFVGGGMELDCTQEAEQARNILVNQILRIVQAQYGGGLNFDGILLTGGGSALLYNQLTAENLGNENIIAADNLDQLHFANVRGGLKLWRLYERFSI